MFIFHLAQLARRRGQHRCRIAEAVQQSAANSRPDAIHQGKTHRIDQIGIVVGHGGSGTGWAFYGGWGIATTPHRGNTPEYNLGRTGEQA